MTDRVGPRRRRAGLWLGALLLSGALATLALTAWSRAALPRLSERELGDRIREMLGEEPYPTPPDDPLKGKNWWRDQQNDRSEYWWRDALYDSIDQWWGERPASVIDLGSWTLCVRWGAYRRMDQMLASRVPLGGIVVAEFRGGTIPEECLESWPSGKMAMIGHLYVIAVPTSLWSRLRWALRAVPADAVRSHAGGIRSW
ncbi:MAG: hypothetical protein ACT4PV_15605 [Planctomycetaceae bacterium]